MPSPKLITAEQLIRNRARIRMWDRIAADRKAILSLQVKAAHHGRKPEPEDQRTIDLLTRRIEFCTMLRTNL